MARERDREYGVDGAGVSFVHAHVADGERRRSVVVCNRAGALASPRSWHWQACVRLTTKVSFGSNVVSPPPERRSSSTSIRCERQPTRDGSVVRRCSRASIATRVVNRDGLCARRGEGNREDRVDGAAFPSVRLTSEIRIPGRPSSSAIVTVACAIGDGGVTALAQIHDKGLSAFCRSVVEQRDVDDLRCGSCREGQGPRRGRRNPCSLRPCHLAVA